MALKDLKSDLSWYGKSSPGPYKTNTSVKDTKYQGVDDVPFVEVTGYDNFGNTVTFKNAFAGNNFLIDDVTHSDRGSASRKAQLGNGTKFPIGDSGTVHEFDIIRTGFSNTNKYSETYGVKHKNSGLADTYTADSPIDDMYNKFLVREEAHNPGFIKHPLILRGIQREDNSDPQRWGLGGTTAGAISATLDLPRGGILTSVERAAVDTARISKFLVSPTGLGFLTRRFGYHLMNPNLENAAGVALGLPATQLYNPISAPTAALTSFLGIRPKHHGIPLITGGLLGGGGPNEYSRRKVLQNATFGLGDATSASGLGFSGFLNRLNNLRTESFISPFNAASVVGLPFITMTGPKGPKSVLGIGVTTHTRAVDTSLSGQSIYGSLDALDKLSFDLSTNKYGEIFTTLNTYTNYRGANSQPFTIQDVDEGENLEGDRKMRGPLSQQQNNQFVVFTGNFPQLQDAFTNKSGKGGGNEQLVKEDGKPESDIAVKGYYKTLPYSALIKREGKIYRSFSGDSLNAFGANDLASDYDQNETLEGKYKYTNYGPSSRDAGKIKAQPDAIQNKAFGTDYEEDVDLIKFKFSPLRLTNSLAATDGNPIIFRAYMNDLSDSFQPSWQENNDQGRADAKIMLESWRRDISLSFIVPLHSKDEIENCWQKLDELAQLTYPVYVRGKSFTGTYVRATIGDLYVNQAMYMQDLSYNWDNETPWELETGKQVPYYTNIDMTLGWIGEQRPEAGIPAFSINSVT